MSATCQQQASLRAGHYRPLHRRGTHPRGAHAAPVACSTSSSCVSSRFEASQLVTAACQGRSLRGAGRAVRLRVAASTGTSEGDFTVFVPEPNSGRGGEGLVSRVSAMAAGVKRWFEDPLRQRLFATVFLIVAIRVAYYVPLPCFSGLKQAKGSNVLDLFVPIEFGEFAAMFGGLSICHMGISPYISSSIFMAFLFAGVPSLREWRKDQGASGVDVMTQTTRKVGLLVSVGQALYTAMQLRPIAPPALQALPVMAYLEMTAIPLAAGTTCLMWIAEEITRVGIGQGTSVVISMSIIAAYLAALRGAGPALLSGELPLWVAGAVVAAMGLLSAAAVVVNEKVRRVPIVFFQQQGAPALQADGKALTDDYVPFRANPTGIQPILFAVCLLDGLPWLLSVMSLPSWVGAGFSWLFSPESALYYIAYWAIVFGFTFLDVEDVPKEISDYMVKIGARVPGVRPGDPTIEHFRNEQNRARFFGGFLLATLSTGSQLADKLLRANYGKSVGFTSLLILVGTVLQMRRQILAYAQKPALEKVIAEL